MQYLKWCKMYGSLNKFANLQNSTILHCDFYDIKTLWFEFGNYIFTGFKMPTLLNWNVLFSAIFIRWHWRPLSLKCWHFVASEDSITKFKSQGLYTIKLKYWNANGSGFPPSLIPALWNIDVLLHKQATWIKHFCPECIRQLNVKITVESGTELKNCI